MPANLENDRRALIASEIPLIGRRRGSGALRVALCYPNTYFLGMSNLGFHAVYRLLATAPEVACERVFAAETAGASKAALASLESGMELRRFDVLAFSVSFEDDYVNLARMLRQAGIPLRSSQRGPRDPLIVVGGAAAFLNPEPIAPFADVIAVGEGEALVDRLLESLLGAPEPRRGLETLHERDGFYLPSRHIFHYDREGRIVGRDGPDRVVRQRARLDCDALSESAFLTPRTELAMKYLVEISRGCPCLCRFCWAGYNYLPVRSRSRERIVQAARAARVHTDKIGLVATAVCDHGEIEGLVDDLGGMGFEVAVSSLRFDDLTSDLVWRLSETGAQGLTLAPECGTDRLRRVVNKQFTNEEIIERVEWIFERGMANLKLYFMVGLPTEEDADVDAIVDLVRSIRESMLRIARPRGRIGRLQIAVNPFIPKPGTPFQWLSLQDPREIERKLSRLRRAMARQPNTRLQIKSARSIRDQAIIALGDRRIADAIEFAATHETSLTHALHAVGIDASPRFSRMRTLDETLPWDVLDNGVAKDFLWREYQSALEARLSPRCPKSAGCVRCGVCRP
ncbi:MAG: radical SAM protein [Vicinamibacteria bacterium]|nr:radical SAM protein [Vicinamibacteria bacterium]